MLEYVRQDRNIERLIVTRDPASIEQGKLHRGFVPPAASRLDGGRGDLEPGKPGGAERTLESGDDAPLSTADVDDTPDGAIDDQLDATRLLAGSQLTPGRVGVVGVELGIVPVQRLGIGAHSPVRSRPQVRKTQSYHRAVTSTARAQSGRRPQEPLVSVLTPSFNQRRWLVETLGSVARQTYPHLEHVVVDGGSTDGSVDVLRAALPAGNWISEPDGGQSEALNKAFDRSRGEIIGWLNSDDAYLFDDAVESVVDYFQANPDVDVVYGHAALVSEAGSLLHVLWMPRYNKSHLWQENVITQPAVFIRRRALEDGFLDESFHYTMDHELWLRLATKHSFGRIDEVLAVDRHQAQRKSYEWPKQADEEVLRLAEMYGIPRSVPFRAAVRRIGYRFRGAPTAFRLRQERKAFDWSLDSRARLLLRQLIVKRRFMATGATDPI